MLRKNLKHTMNILTMEACKIQLEQEEHVSQEEPSINIFYVI